MYPLSYSSDIDTQLKTYKVGDIVDIVGNSAQQKGLPYKYYHGKTGVVFNITKSAVGVAVQKIVGNRYIEKRLHVRVEHVRHSRCRDGTSQLKYSPLMADFLRRVKENAEKRRTAKASGSTLPYVYNSNIQQLFTSRDSLPCLVKLDLSSILLTMLKRSTPFPTIHTFKLVWHVWCRVIRVDYVLQVQSQITRVILQVPLPSVIAVGFCIIVKSEK